VHALTDVTGFGLLGHLLEICKGSSLQAKLDMVQIPVIREAQAFAEQGYGPGAIERNQASFDQAVDYADSVSQWQRRLLADPQTSGGLLVSVAAEQADAVLAAFHAQGFGYARVIGRLEAGAARIRVD
jgi:selenide,water dikinase